MPNIIYDIVLGGALTSVVMPVLAGPAARRLRRHRQRHPGQRRTRPAPGPASAENQASQIASALLTWTVLLLAPVSVIIAVAAGPLTTLLLAGAPRCAHAAIVGVSSRMLVVFAPQILLYGLAVVLYGILQAHRRFTAPALAPVVSSVVVISAYLAFVPLGQGYRVLAALPRSGRADAVGRHHGGGGRPGADRAGPGAAAAAAAAAHAAFPGRGGPAGAGPGRGGADRR